MDFEFYGRVHPDNLSSKLVTGNALLLEAALAVRRNVHYNYTSVLRHTASDDQKED
jgi:hypothetical protein